MENKYELTCMDFFPSDGEFFVTLKFDKKNESTAAKLLKCLHNEEDLLPDLKVTKIYRRNEDENSVIALDKLIESEVILKDINLLVNKLQNVVYKTTYDEIKTDEGLHYLTKSLI